MNTNKMITLNAGSKSLRDMMWLLTAAREREAADRFADFFGKFQVLRGDEGLVAVASDGARLHMLTGLVESGFTEGWWVLLGSDGEKCIFKKIDFDKSPEWHKVLTAEFDEKVGLVVCSLRDFSYVEGLVERSLNHRFLLDVLQWGGVGDDGLRVDIQWSYCNPNSPVEISYGNRVALIMPMVSGIKRVDLDVA